MTGVKMQSAIGKTAGIDHRSFIKNPAKPRQPLLPLGRVEGILRHGTVPGEIAKTAMPCGWVSAAKHSVKRISAVLLVLPGLTHRVTQDTKYGIQVE
jgi:hypothetical protein